jgi:hypothetical protein
MAQAVGRKEALVLHMEGDAGELIWMNSSCVRVVPLSQLADLAGNEKSAAVDIVVHGRIACSVSLERIPAEALASFLEHMHQRLRRALQDRKEALAAAERARLASGLGPNHGGPGPSTWATLMLASLEVPPSLRNREVVNFLQKKGVAEIFEDARNRHTLREKWSRWQRALFQHASQPSLTRRSGGSTPAEQDGDSGDALAGHAGFREEGGGDPVLVIVGGKYRMFAVTRHRILWTQGQGGEGQVPGAGRDTEGNRQGEREGERERERERAGTGQQAEQQTPEAPEGRGGTGRDSVEVRELELYRVAAVQGSGEGHIYFRNANGTTMLHVSRDELGAHEYGLLLDVISASPSLPLSAQRLLIPASQPTAILRNSGGGDNSHVADAQGRERVNVSEDVATGHSHSHSLCE